MTLQRVDDFLTSSDRIGPTTDVRGLHRGRPNFFTETIPAAFERENLLANIPRVIDWWQRSKVPVDMGFNIFDPENLEGTIFDNNPDLWPSLVDVRSRDDILEREQEVLAEMERNDILDRAGGWGFTATMLAGIASPEVLIPVATGARFASTAAKVASGSTSLGVAMVGIEGTLLAAQHTRTKTEALFGVAGAVLLGGVIGGLSRFYTPKEMRVLRESVDREVNMKGVVDDLGEGSIDPATGNVIFNADDFPTTSRVRNEVEDQLGRLEEEIDLLPDKELNQGRRWIAMFRRKDRKNRRAKARSLRESMQETAEAIRLRFNQLTDKASEAELAVARQEAEEVSLLKTQGRNRGAKEEPPDLDLGDQAPKDLDVQGGVGGFEPELEAAEALPGLSLDDVMQQGAGRGLADEFPTDFPLTDIQGFLPGIGTRTLARLKEAEIVTLEDLRLAFLEERFGDVNVPMPMKLRLLNTAFTKVERLALQNEAIDIAMETSDQIAAIAHIARRRPEALADIMEPIPEASLGVGTRSDRVADLDRLLDAERLQAEIDTSVAVAEMRVSQIITDNAERRAEASLLPDGDDKLADLFLRAAEEEIDATSAAKFESIGRDLLRTEWAEREARRVARTRRRSGDTPDRIDARMVRQKARLPEKKEKLSKEEKAKQNKELGQKQAAGEQTGLETIGKAEARSERIAPVKEMKPAAEFEELFDQGTTGVQGMLVRLTEVTDKAGNPLVRRTKANAQLGGVVLGINERGLVEVGMISPVISPVLTRVERLLSRLRASSKKRGELNIDQKPLEKSIKKLTKERTAELLRLRRSGEGRLQVVSRDRLDVAVDEAGAPVFDPKINKAPRRTFLLQGQQTDEALAGGKGSPTGPDTQGTIMHLDDDLEDSLRFHIESMRRTEDGKLRRLTPEEANTERELFLQKTRKKGQKTREPSTAGAAGKLQTLTKRRNLWMKKFQDAVDAGDKEGTTKSAGIIATIDNDMADLSTNPLAFRVRTAEDPFTGRFIERISPVPRTPGSGRTTGVRPDDFEPSPREPTGAQIPTLSTTARPEAEGVGFRFATENLKQSALKTLRAQSQVLTDRLPEVRAKGKDFDIQKIETSIDRLDFRIAETERTKPGPPSPAGARDVKRLEQHRAGAINELRRRARGIRDDGGSIEVAEGLERQAIQIEVRDPDLVNVIDDPFLSGEPDIDTFVDPFMSRTPMDWQLSGVRTIADQVNDLENIADLILGIPTKAAHSIREQTLLNFGDISTAVRLYARRTTKDLLDAGEDPLIVEVRLQNLLERADDLDRNPRQLLSGQSISLQDIDEILNTSGELTRTPGRLKAEIDQATGRTPDDAVEEALDDIDSVDPYGRGEEPNEAGELDFEDLDLADEIPNDPDLGVEGGRGEAGDPSVPPRTPDGGGPKIIKRHGKETGYVDPGQRLEKLKSFWQVGKKGAGMTPERLRWILRHAPKIRNHLSPYAPAVNMGQRLIEPGLTFEKNKFGITPGLSVESNIRSHEAMLLDFVQRMPSAYVRMVKRLRNQPITGDEGLKELLKIRASEFTRKVTGQGRTVTTYDDFLREIGETMFRGDAHETIPEITELAKYFREKLYDDVLERYMNMGVLPEGIDPKIAKSYLTRIWRIRVVKEKSDILKGLIADDWMANDKLGTLTRGDAEDLAEQAMERIRSMPEGHVGWDIFAGSERTSGPRGTRRIFITVPTEKLLEHGFLETNIETQFRFYFRSVVPDLHLMEFDLKMTPKHLRDKGWKPDPNLKLLMKRLESSYYRSIKDSTPGSKEHTLLKKKFHGDMKDLRSFVAEMRGTLGAPADPDSLVVRSMMTTRRFNVLRHMGTFIMSSIPDLARPFMMFGLSKAFRSNYVDMVKDWSTFKLNAKDAWAFGTANDIWLNGRMDRILDFGDVSTRLSKGEDIVRQSADWYGLVSGLSIWNTAIKMQATAGVQTLLAHDLLKWNAVRSLTEAHADDLLRGTTPKGEVAKQLAKNASELDQLAAIRAKGVTPGRTLAITEELSRRGVNLEMIGRIQKELHKRVADGHTSTRGVLEIGSTDWADREAAKHWGSAVRQIVDEMIVTPGVGDKSLWMTNEAGRFFGQYKTFAVTATTKMLLTGMQRNDVAFWNGVLMSTMFAAGSIQMKAWAGGYNTPDSSNWQWWLRNSIDRSGIFGIWADVNNVFGYATRGNFTAGRLLGGGPDPGFKYTDRNLLTEILGPTAGAVVDTGKVLTGLTDIIVSGQEPSLSSANAAKRMTVLQNHILFNRPMKALFRSGRRGITSGLNLKRRPRKRSRRRVQRAAPPQKTGPTPEEIALANINR